jgi:uncharacterized linocin/CFP29 family protein
MADILRRSLSPVTDEAWAEIDRQAAIIIKGNLSGRTVADFDGPHGWTLGAVNVGRVDVSSKAAVGGVQWGVREVLPLVEIRVPFALSLMELDGVSRGSKNPDLQSLEKAAEKAAVFEEKAVYNGFKPGCIEGMTTASPHKALTLGKKPDTYQAVVETSVVNIEKEGIGGPFDLILGTVPFQTLMAGDDHGYPLRKRIEALIRGEIRWSPALTGGVIVSRRGGDYELTVGQDFSIGYYGHDRETVDLYITESFTFRVIEPRAAVALNLKA